MTQDLGRAARDAAHWRQRLTQLMAKHHVPGAALGYLRDGAIVDIGAGVTSTATGVDVTADTVFQIGSITKVWTATLIMQLVDEGLLDLDAPVVDVLPDFAVADPDVTRSVTTRQLLNHTSGIDGDYFADTGRGDDCVAAYVADMAKLKQNHPIGRTWSYCNSGFTLAGRIVEKLRGTSWDTALRERLLRPLGLTATTTLPEEAVLHRAAVGHIGEPGGPLTPTPVWGLPRSAGPAGLISARVHDVLAFARMHLDGGRTPSGATVLSTQNTVAMQQKEVDLPETHTLGDSWGIGWIRFDWGGHRLFGHDGNTIGQSAFLRILPEQGLAVALLTNGGNTRDLYQELYGEIFAELAGIELPDPLAPASTPPAVDTARYVGVYERTSVRTEVFERDGGLVLRSTVSGALADLQPEPTHEYPLLAVAEDLFAMRPEGTTTWSAVRFYGLDDGSRYVHYGARANPLVVG
jgi:CubicO group peptidase (beta-lactamase class C family)